MITHDVVIAQISRLFDNYSATANHQMREAKISFLLHELKHWNNGDFVKVCDKILKESKNRSFPTLEDFTSRWHSVKTEQHDFINHKFCAQCGETGYYTVWQMRGVGKHWYRFPYRCHCNDVTMPSLRHIDPTCIPTKAHNPYPPGDAKHEIYNQRVG